jgi:acetyl-CoA carboxylase biotin carboxyl carrier protein
MKQITAMMAGVVVEILVQPGQQLAEGQDVVILESMKMQLPVQADLAGKVAEIKVAAGDFINEGEPILTLE